MTKLFLPVLVTLTVLAGCTRLSSDTKDQIIARANGEPIFAKEFLLSYGQLRAEQDEISRNMF